MAIYVSGGHVIGSGGRVITQPSGLPGWDGFISISGNKFVNGHGTTLLLKGANNSGLELCGPFGEQPWGGNPPSYTLMQAWGFNMARFPLNSASWLGQTTFTPTNATTWGVQNNAGVGNGTQDPFANYQAAVLAVITACRAVNIYPIFDLHWGAMQLTLGGVTRNASYQGQLAFMDTSGFTFWCDAVSGLIPGIAAQFGSAAFNTANSINGGAAGASWNPSIGGASGFGDVAFELFNEPFMGNASETYGAGSADLALLNGGACNKYVTNGNGNITTPVTLAGYQAIVTGIRAFVGCTNPIIINGNEYTSNLQNYLTWAPSDTANQIAYGWHTYCLAPWPNTVNPFSFPNTGSDSGAGTSASFSHAQNILNAGSPVIITEDGTDNGNNAGTFEVFTVNGGYDPHLDFMAAWAAPLNVGYLPWTFGGQDFYQAFTTSAASNVLLRRDAAGTGLLPIQGAGWSAYKYISGNVAPTITNSTTLPGGTASTSNTVTFIGAGGAGSPYTYAWVSDSGSGSSSGSLNTTSGVMSWTLTATPGTYSIVIRVLDKYLVFNQITFSIVVSSGGGGGSSPTFVQLILQGGAKPGDNQGLGGDGHGPGTVSQPNRQLVGWKSVASATSYNIYRSVTTVAGTNGLYTLYDSVSSTTSGANYTTYVASCTNANGGSPFDPAPGIDSVYTDTAATTCVSPTDAKGPSSGIYYGPVTGYNYKITAIVGGVESVQSVDDIAIFMGNGKWIHCFGIFNNPPVVTKNSAAPAVSPLGFNNATFLTLGHFPATQAFVNPFTGGACVWGNMNVTGYNFYNFNVYPTAWVNGDMQQSTEIDGDLFIYNTITPTMNVTLNQWNPFKFSLSSLLNSTNGSGSTMNAAANGVPQTSYYKTTWNNGASTNQNMVFWVESYFSRS